MKRSNATLELVNTFPGWSRVRWDEQSTGFQFLNPIGVRMEEVDKFIEKHRRNNFLTTANLDEIDQIYTASLPKTFSFTVDTSDPTNPVSVAPTVYGTIDTDIFTGEVVVELADKNDLETFWYTSVPDRITLETTISNPTAILVSQASEAFPFSENNSSLWRLSISKQKVGSVYYQR
jgi:hypothetical protein